FGGSGSASRARRTGRGGKGRRRHPGRVTTDRGRAIGRHAPAGSIPPTDLVALVASAGGLAALTAVLSHLPADFPAAVVVLQHLDPNRPSLLSEILGRHSGLPVCEAHHGDLLRRGVVFVAPPGHHLLVGAGGVLELTS